MRPAPGLHIEWVEEEAVVLDPETGHLHYLNPSAAYVYALICEYGFEDASSKIESRFEEGTPMRRELPALLEDMRSKGLLVPD